MSLKLTLQEFQKRIPENFRNKIEILRFNGSSKPLVFKILETGEIKTISQARKIERFQSLDRCGMKTQTDVKPMQEKVDSLFGKEVLEVLIYNGVNLPCTVKCRVCGAVKELASPEAVYKRAFPCHCLYEANDKKRVQQAIDEQFGEGEYTIVKYRVRNEHILIRHKCGFIFEKATFYTLQNMRGCPKCFKAVSKGEQEVAKVLGKLQIPYSTQFTFSDLRGDKYPLRFDFVINSAERVMLIEFDGEGHYQYRECFGEKTDFETTQKHDTLKNAYCKNNDIPLLRIPYWEFKNIKKLILNFLWLNDYPLGEYPSSEVETLNS